MNEPRKIVWPAWVLILDLVGTVLVGFGIYAQVVDGELLFAEFLDLRAVAVPMIIIGALMTAPLVLMTVSQIRSRR